MSLIIGLLILLVAIIIIKLILDQLTLPDPLKYVVMLVLSLIVLIIILERAGGLGGVRWL